MIRLPSVLNGAVCFVSFLVVLTGFGSNAAGAVDGVAQPKPPLDIGSRRQVFINGRFLDKVRNVELIVHQPTKTGELSVKPEYPWEQGGIGPYSSVLKEGDTYHMWYQVMDTVQWNGEASEVRGAICYARSADGIHWKKPMLGITDYQGNKENNIVLGQGAGDVYIGQDGGMVFLDPTAPTDQRFRFVIRINRLNKYVHIFSSGDGLHWKMTHRSAITYRPMEKGHHLDSQNVIFYDDRINKYVAYVRKNLMRWPSAGRTIARAESDRLDGFPVVQDMPIVLGPDSSDLHHEEVAMVDYYMSAAVKYPWAEDAYYMFPTAYYHYMGRFSREFAEDCPTNAGPLHTQFAASRDGVAWERYDRRPFVDLGRKGQFDWASSRTMWGIVPSVDDQEMYLYYRASDWLHGWDRDERNKRLLTAAGLGADQNIAVISRVVSRKDGFVSARAAYTGGEFITPPLIFKGSKLVLNVDTSATGIVQVEILDQDGAPLTDSRWRIDDCDRIHTANEINRAVTWRGNSNLSEFAGKPIRLRFVMWDTDLYAFQFQD